MHCFFTHLVLGGLSALVIAEPLPVIEHTLAEPTCTDEIEPPYQYTALSPVGTGTGDTTLPTSPSGILSSSTVGNSTLYAATGIAGTSTETPSPYPYTLMNLTDSVGPLGTESRSSSAAAPISTSLDGYSYTFPPFVTSTYVGVSTGEPSGSTVAPLSTSVSSGTPLAPYGTGPLPSYVNSSTAEPIQAQTYGYTFASGISDVSASPTSTVEQTTHVTISATSTLTSTVSSSNGSSVGPAAPTTSANATYPTAGVSSGSILGGITANSTSTSGVSPHHGPYTPSGFPTLSTSSVLGTNPSSGSSPLVGPLSTGSGVSSLPSSGTAASVIAPSTYSYSLPIITSSSIGTSPASGSLSYLGPLSTGTGVSSILSSGTGGSATSLLIYPPTYPNITSTSLAGPTAISTGYTMSPLNTTSEISSTPSPVDTTCTETLTATRADGSGGTTTDILTTFVTSTYPSASLNSTPGESPITASSPSVTIPILTTAPIIISTSALSTYSPVFPYPIASIPVPTEYYHHHRRPPSGNYGFPYWLFGGGDEEESSEGYGYDDGEEYDYGDGGDYK